MKRVNGPAALAADALRWVSDLDGLDQERAGGTFCNPIYKGADPWVTQRGGWYYLVEAEPDGTLAVWKSASPVDKGRRSVVWTPPSTGWNAQQIWAPELHWLDGRWYIYYAASDGWNANHRMGVLESVSDDPQGAFVDKGMLYTGDHADTGRQNRWAIDGTILEMGGRRYLIWSGWEDERDIQYLYIAAMKNPWTVAENRVKLCDNCCHDWERVGESRNYRGLHEGPAILQRNGKVFLIYSCSGSWQASYKLGMLWMDEVDDPMNPASWHKVNRPVFESTEEVFGVGHCSFVQSPDGTEDWIVYHAKRSRANGWDRVVRAQPFGWDEVGMPVFGRPVASGRMMNRPSVGAPILHGAAMPLKVAAAR